MELTKKVRVTLFSSDPMDDALKVGFGLRDLLETKGIPYGKGTYVVVGEVSLGQLLDALDKGVLNTPSCLGVSLYYPPKEETGPPAVQHEQTQSSLATVLHSLPPRAFEDGFDIRWGEVADAFA